MDGPHGNRIAGFIGALFESGYGPTLPHGDPLGTEAFREYAAVAPMEQRRVKMTRN